MPDPEFATALIAIGAIALAAGFVHSAIGFGFGIVALAAIPLVLDMRSSHVVVSLASIPMMVVASWAFREGIDWRTLRVAVVASLLFLPLGLLAFEVAPMSWLVRGTGVAILTMAVLSLRESNAKKSQDSSMSACFAAGAASGFLAGAVSIAGPPIAAFALKQDWPQIRFKAFVTQCLLVIAFAKGVLLVGRGWVTSESAWQAVVAAPFAILGVHLGVIASRRIPAALFKRLVAVVLILIACQMIWRG